MASNFYCLNLGSTLVAAGAALRSLQGHTTISWKKSMFSNFTHKEWFLNTNSLSQGLSSEMNIIKLNLENLAPFQNLFVYVT